MWPKVGVERPMRWKPDQFRRIRHQGWIWGVRAVEECFQPPTKLPKVELRHRDKCLRPGTPMRGAHHSAAGNTSGAPSPCFRTAAIYLAVFHDANLLITVHAARCTGPRLLSHPITIGTPPSATR